MTTLETAVTMVTKMKQITIGVHDVRKRNSIKVFSLYELLWLQGVDGHTFDEMKMYGAVPFHMGSTPNSDYFPQVTKKQQAHEQILWDFYSMMKLKWYPFIKL